MKLDSSGISVGRYRSRRAVWERYLNLRADEHDEGDQVLNVPETVCPSDAQLDRVVGGFNASVAQTVLNRVEDVPRVTLDLASQLLHGLDAGMRRAPIPFLQAIPDRF